MRMRLIALGLIIAAMLTSYGFLLAQAWTQQTTVISSATVPVNVMTAAARKSFCIQPRSTAIVCFSYNGTIPTAVPSAAAYQINTNGFCNSLTGVGDTAINEAWGCVPAAAGTTTVDSTWR
jgi:hypothetical protein